MAQGVVRALIWVPDRHVHSFVILLTSSYNQPNPDTNHLIVYIYVQQDSMLTYLEADFLIDLGSTDGVGSVSVTCVFKSPLVVFRRLGWIRR